MNSDKKKVTKKKVTKKKVTKKKVTKKKVTKKKVTKKKNEKILTFFSFKRDSKLHTFFHFIFPIVFGLYFVWATELNQTHTIKYVCIAVANLTFANYLFYRIEMVNIYKNISNEMFKIILVFFGYTTAIIYAFIMTSLLTMNTLLPKSELNKTKINCFNDFNFKSCCTVLTINGAWRFHKDTRKKAMSILLENAKVNYRDNIGLLRSIETAYKSIDTGTFKTDLKALRKSCNELARESK